MKFTPTPLSSTALFSVIDGLPQLDLDGLRQAKRITDALLTLYELIPGPLRIDNSF